MTTPPITALDREAAALLPMEATPEMLEAVVPVPAHWDLDGPDGRVMWAAVQTDRLVAAQTWRTMADAAFARTAAERATSPAGDAGEVARVARAINPRPFKQWQSMYDYCLRQGDSEVVARRYADDTHLADCEHALDAARAAIAAILPQAGDADVVGEVSIEAALGVERCKLCMTYAPRSFCHECDRPECPYRGTAHPHASASDVVGEPGA